MDTASTEAQPGDTATITLDSSASPQRSSHTVRLLSSTSPLGGPHTNAMSMGLTGSCISTAQRYQSYTMMDEVVYHWPGHYGEADHTVYPQQQVLDPSNNQT
jgi:hypothetical protein